LPVVPIDNTLDDSKAQASASLFAAAVKTLQQRALVRFANTRSVVPDC
jgi:hypothetical protein